MRRWVLAVFAMMVIGAAVAGAGYLGRRGLDQEAALAVEAPPTVAVTRGDVQQTITAPGRIVSTQQVRLALDVGGKVIAVDVRSGESVQTGDVLARLDPEPFERSVDSAQASLEAARAQLELLQHGPSTAELATAQLALAQARNRLDRLQSGPSASQMAAAEADVAAAQEELAYLQSLPEPGAVAQVRAELDLAGVALQQAQAAYDQVADRPEVGMLPQALHLQKATIVYDGARARLDAVTRPATPTQLRASLTRLASAQTNLAQLRAGPSRGDLRVAHMQLAKAEADLAELTAGPPLSTQKQAEAAVRAADLALQQAQANLKAATLTAPFDGTALEVNAAAGDTVGAGAALIRLADTSVVEIEATVIEEDLPLVQVGQPVQLFFDAVPEAEVRGVVARIVPQRIPGDRPLYPVRITAGELPEGLLPGMTVDASIVRASRPDVLQLPRVVTRATAGDTAVVHVWTGADSEERQVRLGLRGDVYVEILHGLRQGEQVVCE